MKTIIIAAVTGILVGIIVIWFGLYNVAANDRHLATTTKLLEMVRVRSINMRSNDINVPPLSDEKLIKEGAVHYAEMCTGCHLAPGIADSELHTGLYPQPPVFSAGTYSNTPEAQFWVIKNGLKMTGMPAWSPAHTDQQIWGMVAFLQKIKTLSAEEYMLLSQSDGDGHDHDHGASSNNTAEEHHAESEAADDHAMPADDGHNHSH